MKRHFISGLTFVSIMIGGQLIAPPVQSEPKYDRHHEEVHAERPHVQDLPIHHFGRLPTCKGWWAP